MKSVRNAARALALFALDRTSVSVTEVSAELGISMSVASRLLSTLRDQEVLEQDGTKRYRPGMVANQLGLVYHTQNKLPELVVQAARELTAQTGLTTWTSVLSETDALLLARFAGPSQHQFQVDPSSRLPAHACASGKALLARMSDSEVRHLYPSPVLPARTKRSISSLMALLDDLALVRIRGWSEVNEELFLGTRSLGAAVRGLNEPTAMAISISFATSRFDEDDVRLIGARLIRICQAIGRRVGDAYWIARQDLPLSVEMAKVTSSATGRPLRQSKSTESADRRNRQAR